MDTAPNEMAAVRDAGAKAETDEPGLEGASPRKAAAKAKKPRRGLSLYDLQPALKKGKKARPRRTVKAAAPSSPP